ncbi:hypothetical protein [Allobacillus halotolerans]|uniref:hypothetical protein n=1 Tax=Allobacillus halotolerans TaxID=570278 RepID=UPI001FE466C7|nr:hypothetical protein [Allobacillus halotolerans]
MYQKIRGDFLHVFAYFPEYNWCGPGCHGPETPVNAVDAACKAHDMYYDQYGPSCGCDREATFILHYTKVAGR